jgi:hypothetical protein
MSINEPRMTAHDINMISSELIFDDINFGTHDALTPEGQVLHLDILLDSVPCAVDVPLPIAGEVGDSLLKGLTGDSPRVNADTTNNLPFVDDRDPFSNLCSLNCGTLSGRPTANYDQIVIEL